MKDPVAWVYNDRDHDDDTVRQIAESAIREVVGKSKMDFVLYEGREQIAIDANKLMQQIADRYAMGVQITNVTMQSVQPPEQVQSAFDDAVKANQDRQKAKSEGEAYANDIIPRSRGAAIRLTQDAEAYRSQVVENATGNASRFAQVVTEYQKAPAVTRDRMYLDTMQQIFSSASKVMVDAKSEQLLPAARQIDCPDRRQRRRHRQPFRSGECGVAGPAADAAGAAAGEGQSQAQPQ